MFGPPVFNHNLQNMIAQHTMPFHTPMPPIPYMMPHNMIHDHMMASMRFSLGPPLLPTITPDMHVSAICHVDTLTNKLFNTPSGQIAPLVEQKTQGVIDKITSIITPATGEPKSLCHDRCDINFAVREAKAGASLPSTKAGTFVVKVSNVIIDEHCHDMCDKGKYPDTDKPSMTDKEFRDAVSTELFGKPLDIKK